MPATTENLSGAHLLTSTTVPRMQSPRLPILALLIAGLLSTPIACSTSSRATTDGDPGCAALSACCALLSGAQAASCQATLETGGMTAGACSEALSAFQSGGACGGSGSGSDSGSGGCAQLTGCCATLPVSEIPTECTAVAMTGTTEACNESLSQYQGDGYCLAPNTQIYCLNEYTCTASVQAEGGTAACGSGSTFDTSACQDEGIIGCCAKPGAAGYTCYFDDCMSGGGCDPESECAASGGTWTDGVPSGDAGAGDGGGEGGREGGDGGDAGTEAGDTFVCTLSLSSDDAVSVCWGHSPTCQGTHASACPATGLIGCCEPYVSEGTGQYACAYAGCPPGDCVTTEAQCSAEMGRWTTTVP